MFRLVYFLKRLLKRMWVRSALFCAVAVLTAGCSFLIAPVIPEHVAKAIGADSVDSVLTVLASSMLAVTTFSLATMVSGYSSASSSTTPRALSLLIEDSTAQNALATFIGAFIFSIVGVMLLSTGVYDAGGRLVLLGVTIVVLIAVVVVLLRWIDQLARLGRVHETIDRVEEAAIAALVADRAAPRLGASPPADISNAAFAIVHDEIGYVQEIDVASLDAIAEAAGAPVHLLVRTGAFVHPGRPVMRLAVELDEEAKAAAVAALIVGADRVYDHDPRFGVIALSEIASRALSKAINDPGTVIDVVNTMVRVLLAWDRAEADPAARAYARVHMPEVDPEELLDDAFSAIARDAAPLIEAQIRLQKAFAAIATARDPALAAAARRMADHARRRAERALDDERDLARLAAAALEP